MCPVAVLSLVFRVRFMASPSPHSQTTKLADLRKDGFSQAAALRIICDAATAFDRAGKGYGQHSGPLGNAGCALYAKLLHADAFDTNTPYRTAEVAQATKLAKSSVHQAIQRLIAHHFLFQEKRGYSFLYRVSVPDDAMWALGEYCDDPELNECTRELGARVRALFPKP
jgi:hypothetical protein